MTTVTKYLLMLFLVAAASGWGVTIRFALLLLVVLGVLHHTVTLSLQS